MEEVVSKSKEEMDKAIEKMRQDNELRIKTLEEQHSNLIMVLHSSNFTLAARRHVRHNLIALSLTP